MKQLFYKLSTPKYFYHACGRAIPWCWMIASVLLSLGLVFGLFIAPPDYQQGDSYRIMFIHVPSAFCSMAIYSSIAFSSALFLIWRTKVSDVIATVSVPIGAMFTFLALVTGSIWGRPTWGTFWIWDARLTSELILLFLYFGLFALHRAIENEQQAQKATAILALIGAIDLPIIHYSVYWWHSLHQNSTLLGFHKPTMAASMLTPLLLMLFAFVFYATALILSACRNEIISRNVDSQWVRESLIPEGAS